jgi:hypothetical protein
MYILPELVIFFCPSLSPCLSELLPTGKHQCISKCKEVKSSILYTAHWHDKGRLGDSQQLKASDILKFGASPLCYFDMLCHTSGQLKDSNVTI